jgi:hypothetical protein
VRTLWRLGEDRASAGFWGTLGMGAVSPYPPAFRLYVRTLAAFVADRARDPVFGVPNQEADSMVAAIGTRPSHQHPKGPPHPLYPLSFTYHQGWRNE